MLLVRGIVKGIKKVERVDQKTGEVYVKHFVGFASQKDGGYDGEESITEVQISDKLLRQGLAATYEGLRGQEHVAPVFPQAWAGKQGAQISWYFSGDGLPIKPEKSEPIKKVS